MSVRRCITATVVLSLASITLGGCAMLGHGSSSQVATSFGDGGLTAEQDLGDPSDQRAVRAASVAALSDEIQAFAVDRELRGQKSSEALRSLTAPASVRERTGLFARAHSSRLAKDLEKAFEFYARQDFGAGWPGSGSQAARLDSDVWADGAFHVDKWQGVRIAGETARVLVRGEDLGTSWGGAPKRDAWRQEQLILHRDATAPHGWRIVEHDAATTAP